MTLFALVDCNNFYASCERVFNPALEGKPIIVLSNNDGCVIARSNEAKQFIEMGAPYFKCRPICEKQGIAAFSSNYELYGDMSTRVMSCLQSFCPEIEIYSIDEAFLSFATFNNFNLLDYSTEIKTRVKACTGIPVSIGVAPTKTLAKIANHIAKKQTTTGVFVLGDPQAIVAALAHFPVASIWGVGRRIAARLNKFAIYTAGDLMRADPKLMRREFSVVMEKLIAELNGISCIPLEELPPAKQQIMSSRSFGTPIVLLSELEESVSTYAARACLKLRNQQSVAGGIYVFLHTNPFRPDQKQYSNTFSYQFTQPTDDTRSIVTQAKLCMKKIYKPGFYYKKAGVMLLNLMPKEMQQYDLFNKTVKSNSAEVMNVLDKINQRFGKKTLFLCAEGIKQPWQARRNKISKRYTTQWHELAKVICKK
ncbi:MAG: Y-family DNA polymerase [Pseudomonadota bacterium]